MPSKAGKNFGNESNTLDNVVITTCRILSAIRKASGPDLSHAGPNFSGLGLLGERAVDLLMYAPAFEGGDHTETIKLVYIITQILQVVPSSLVP
jgi:hypothetical protein